MESSEIEFITIGEILAPWGNRGKLKVRSMTDFPQRFSPSSTIYINRQPATVDSVEWRKGKVIIKLNTIDSPEHAQKLRGQLVEISASQVYTLPEGQYYHFQLIGLEVWTIEGELLGTIADILTADSNDNYVVRQANSEILIPAIEDVVKSIDLDKKRLVIEPIKGLLELRKKSAS